MIKVFQKGWYDISYDVFWKSSIKQVADPTFYKKFYDVFYQRYTSWDSLPAPYVKTRRLVAAQLAKQIIHKKAASVLSLGCGNGLVEKELVKLIPDLKLFVFEPDETNFKWLKQLPTIQLCHGKFPTCLPERQSYDLVYLCDVDPVFSDEAYMTLLTSIKQLTSAPVILTHVIKPLPTKQAYLKYWLKFILAKLGLYRLGQLQGYSRYFHEHQVIIKRAGYTLLAKGDLSENYMWMEIMPA